MLRKLWSDADGYTLYKIMKMPESEMEENHAGPTEGPDIIYKNHSAKNVKEAIRKMKDLKSAAAKACRLDRAGQRDAWPGSAGSAGSAGCADDGAFPEVPDWHTAFIYRHAEQGL